LWEEVQKQLDSQLECILILKYKLLWVLLSLLVPGEDVRLLSKITETELVMEDLHILYQVYCRTRIRSHIYFYECFFTHLNR